MDEQRNADRKLERWMVEKAKVASNIHDAESMLLTAKMLFPTFDVEHAAFGTYCVRQNVAGAAASIQQMFVKFKSEPAFWRQAYLLVQAVRTDPATADQATTFRRTVFNHLLPALQQTLLLELFEKEPDQEEKCQLVLLLMRLFPESSASFATMLQQLLEKYEKPFFDSRNPPEVDNFFTSILVNDVVSLLLNNPSSTVTEAQGVRLLYRVVGFFLAKIVQSPDANGPDGWRSILQYFTWMVKRWHWPCAASLLDFKAINSGPFWNAATNLPTGCAQANCIAIVACARALYDLSTMFPSACLLLHPGLVWDDHAQSFQPFQYDLSMVTSFFDDLPNQLAAPTFRCCINAVDILYQCDEGTVKMEQMLRGEQFERLLAIFRGVCLLRGHIAHIIEASNSASGSSLPKWSVVQLVGCHLANENYKLVVTAVLPLLCKADSLSMLDNSLTTNRDWHFALTKEDDMVQYYIRVLVCCLASQIMSKCKGEPDEMIGHCLVLMQHHWPIWQHLFDRFKAIWTSRKRFAYANFFRYVTDPDVIESIAYFAIKEPDVEMVLGNLNKATAKKCQTKIAGKGLQGEAFKEYMERYMVNRRSSLSECLKLFISEQHEAVKKCLLTVVGK